MLAGKMIRQSLIANKFKFVSGLLLKKISSSVLFYFSRSIYDSNESIDVVHGESNFFIEVMDELGLFIDK
jgi:hypothetical protein